MTKFEFQPFDKVLVRDGENQTWRADFYSHEDATSWPFCCMAGSDWKFCIPYNETTKHLCGTSDPYIDPAESPAFEFGDVVGFLFNGEKHIGFITRIERSYDSCRSKDKYTALTKNGFEWENFKEAFSFIRKGNFND